MAENFFCYFFHNSNIFNILLTFSKKNSDFFASVQNFFSIFGIFDDVTAHVHEYLEFFYYFSRNLRIFSDFLVSYSMGQLKLSDNRCFQGVPPLGCMEMGVVGVADQNLFFSPLIQCFPQLFSLVMAKNSKWRALGANNTKNSHFWPPF